MEDQEFLTVIAKVDNMMIIYQFIVKIANKGVKTVLTSFYALIAIKTIFCSQVLAFVN